MRQSLQSKFNALGILFVVFFLLMLPMFTQVKADARQSAKEAKSTLLSKMFRDIAKDFRPDNLDDTEVEDYWAKYGNEAKEKDPECGAACDPDGDKDGDGVSNKDEVKNGTNPSCNEKEKGEEFCKGFDPYAPVDPKNETKRQPFYELLMYAEWRIPGGAGTNCTGGGPSSIQASCTAKDFTSGRNYSRIIVYLNVTNYQGSGWSLTPTSPADGAGSWQPSNGRTGGTSTVVNPAPDRMSVGTFEEAAMGQYRFSLNPASGQFAQQGAWNLSAYGLVEG